jgi:hypothetical protein
VFEQVVGGLAPDPRIRVRHRAQHVVVVLEDVRVDRPDPQPALDRVLGQLAVVLDAVPGDVQRHAAGHAGVLVHLPGVRDLLEGVSGNALLREHLEARPGVAERPRRQLDALLEQDGDDVCPVGHCDHPYLVSPVGAPI